MTDILCGNNARSDIFTTTILHEHTIIIKHTTHSHAHTHTYTLRQLFQASSFLSSLDYCLCAWVGSCNFFHSCKRCSLDLNVLNVGAETIYFVRVLPVHYPVSEVTPPWSCSHAFFFELQPLSRGHRVMVQLK